MIHTPLTTPDTPRTPATQRASHPMPTRLRAFTVVELLVAIAITSGLILFINQIIVSMSAAVSMGISNSQIIQSSRIINAQLHEDTKSIVPNAGGFMAILQYEVDTLIPDIRNAAYGDGVYLIESDFDDNIHTPIRSDQLVFIREARQDQPVTPRGISAFTPATTTASYIKVWYGHARRTWPDGGDLGLDDRLGARFLNPAGDQIVSQNAIASQWVLGRQAMFLASSVAGLSIYAEESSPPAPVTYNRGARWYSFVTSDGNANQDYVDFNSPPAAPIDPIPVKTPIPPNQNQIYMGLTDTADQRLAEMVSSTESGVMSLEENALHALDYAYPQERLRVNVKPTFSVNSISPHNYKSWQMAQMHPLLAENISDFTVEFAADLDNDGNIDVVTASEAQQIETFYGKDANGNFFIPQNFILGTIKWYSAYYNDPRSGYDSNIPFSKNKHNLLPTDERLFDIKKPFTYRPNFAAFDDITAAQTSSTKPVFLHDLDMNNFQPDINSPIPPIPTRLAPITNTTIRNADAAFIFRPNNAASWPKLLRIRYRLHDKKGQLTDIDATPGSIFEVIVAVPE